MMLTKNDMARNIIAALYNMSNLPPADHKKVLKLAKRKKADLMSEYEKAWKILVDRMPLIHAEAEKEEAIVGDEFCQMFEKLCIEYNLKYDFTKISECGYKYNETRKAFILWSKVSGIGQ